MADPKRVIIDTDPGIDDTAAILMALGSPELQVEALTTVFGNTSVEQCTTNALRILEAAGRADIPVYQGCGRPVNFDEPQFAAHIHGSDGMGEANIPLPTIKAQERHAVLEVIDRVLASPGELTIATIGRQTNLAQAISLEPRIATAIKEVVVMGGAIREPGNASPVATANIWGDPEAADIVYRSGANIVQIGTDVCAKVEISGEQQKRVWQANTSATRLLQKLVPFINSAYSRDNRLANRDGVQFNDVPAMAYVIDPTLFECRDLHVCVECKGEFTRGMTVADMRAMPAEKPNVKVALGVDAPRLTELWVERVRSLRP
jgi:inosine-uridine nucleoside N-ribohydrolase